MRYSASMWALTGKYFVCQTDREDAFQDAQVAVWQGMSRFEGRSRLSTWLHRVTVNVCLMKLRTECRRKRRIKPSSQDLTHPITNVDSPLEVVVLAEQKATLQRAIAELPAASRDVVHLLIAGESVAACATRLRITPGLVTIRFHRAKAILRKMLVTSKEVTASTVPLDRNC